MEIITDGNERDVSHPAESGLGKYSFAIYNVRQRRNVFITGSPMDLKENNEQDFASAYCKTPYTLHFSLF